MNVIDYIITGFEITSTDLMFFRDFSYSDMHPSHYGFKIAIDMLLMGE